MFCTSVVGPVVTFVPSESMRKSKIPPLHSPLSFFIDGNSVEIWILWPVTFQTKWRMMTSSLTALYTFDLGRSKASCESEARIGRSDQLNVTCDRTDQITKLAVHQGLEFISRSVSSQRFLDEISSWIRPDETVVGTGCGADTFDDTLWQIVSHTDDSCPYGTGRALMYRIQKSRLISVVRLHIWQVSSLTCHVDDVKLTCQKEDTTRAVWSLGCLLKNVRSSVSGRSQIRPSIYNVISHMTSQIWQVDSLALHSLIILSRSTLFSSDILVTGKTTNGDWLKSTMERLSLSWSWSSMAEIESFATSNLDKFPPWPKLYKREVRELDEISTYGQAMEPETSRTITRSRSDLPCFLTPSPSSLLPNVTPTHC